MDAYYSSRHVLLGNIDSSSYSTDNNCISLEINYGNNVLVQTNRTGLTGMRENRQVVPVNQRGIQNYTNMDESNESTTRLYDNMLKNLKPRYRNAHGVRNKVNKTTNREECNVSRKHNGKEVSDEVTLIQSNNNVNDTFFKPIVSRDKMVLTERNTSQKQFTALKSRVSLYSVLKFETGATIIVGLPDPFLTPYCVVKTAAGIADTLAHPIEITDVNIVNTVSTFSMFHLDFFSMCSFFRRMCIAFYDPLSFPGLFFKLRVPLYALKSNETVGEFYTKLALLRDRVDKEKEFNIEEWMRVKTALVFKVGKVTILGECGKDDIRVISQLLFGYFHYFMDRNIKMSPRERTRIARRYGIPPLIWYIYVDFQLHSYNFVKPTYEEVRQAVLNQYSDSYISDLDKIYYGKEYGSNKACMSTNLTDPLEKSVQLINALESQMFGNTEGRTKEHMVKYRGMGENKYDFTRGRYTQNSANNTAREKPSCDSGNDKFDHFRFYTLPSAVNFARSLQGTNTERKHWFKKAKYQLNKIVQKCVEENNQQLTDDGYIVGPLLSYVSHRRINRLVSRKCVSGDFSSIRSARDKAIDVVTTRKRKLYTSEYTGVFKRAKNTSPNKSHEDKIKGEKENILRLNTTLSCYEFINEHTTTGHAPECADLLDTDVYSLMHLMDRVPKSKGLATACGEKTVCDSATNTVETQECKTPGDAYFTHVLDENKPVNSDNSSTGRTFIERVIKELGSDKWTRGNGTGSCQPPLPKPTTVSHENLTGVQTLDTSVNAASINEVQTTVQKVCRSAPSDFIKNVHTYKDEKTGTDKVRLVFNKHNIVNSMLQTRGHTVSPVANYRTSLHSHIQNKTNLTKPIIEALKEDGATKSDIDEFIRLIDHNKGKVSLCSLINYFSPNLQ